MLASPSMRARPAGTVDRWIRLKQRLRPCRLLAVDALDSLLRRRPAFVPPRREVEKIGGFDFLEIGNQLAAIARDLGQLQPHERILDVGCGLGRLAVALRDSLPAGEYAGFDVYERGIKWCRTSVEAKHPNFHFTFVDVQNRHYNPRGRILPEEFVFPYATSSFDLAFASSLFTHLTPPAAERYFAEVSRILKPGGRFVGSFFLLNESSRRALAEAQPRFLPVDGHYAVQSLDDPEAAIAFDEQTVKDALERHGIPAVDVRYGGWSFRSEPVSFQDLLIARKVSG